MQEQEKSLEELTACYAQACTFISKYVFDHGFILNFMKLQETLYQTIRAEFGLKSQFTISAFKTVTARYKTVQEQLFQNPYRYENEKRETHFISRTLEWLVSAPRDTVWLYYHISAILKTIKLEFPGRCSNYTVQM